MRITTALRPRAAPRHEFILLRRPTARILKGGGSLVHNDGRPSQSPDGHRHPRSGNAWSAPSGVPLLYLCAVLVGAEIGLGDVLTSRRTGRPYEAPGTGRPPAFAEGRQRGSFDHVV